MSANKNLCICCLERVQIQKDLTDQKRDNYYIMGIRAFVKAFNANMKNLNKKFEWSLTLLNILDNFIQVFFDHYGNKEMPYATRMVFQFVDVLKDTKRVTTHNMYPKIKESYEKVMVYCFLEQYNILYNFAYAEVSEKKFREGKRLVNEMDVPLQEMNYILAGYSPILKEKQKEKKELMK